eukprot:TRINITY_DN43728_c0_g1_i1.p1 TRINITY_DN43728_c0_g1~~TRINITY_DN43728_c0_g1_i1.p1  ORF type:complete len:471 (+),score=142.06 TRINITY_DN43728_c0_g1_i1:50-1414(+)
MASSAGLESEGDKLSAGGDHGGALARYMLALADLERRCKCAATAGEKVRLQSRMAAVCSKAETEKARTKRLVAGRKRYRDPDEPPAKRARNGQAAKRAREETQPEPPSRDETAALMKDPRVAPLLEGLEECLVPSEGVRWADVVGLREAKAALREAVVLPQQFPQLFEGARTPWKGILLYGPPGTGKTLLARAASTEAGTRFLSVSSADLLGKYVGESEQKMRQVFELARALQPCTIFVDEIDSIASARGRSSDDGGSARRMLTELLVQMDGSCKDNTGLLVMAATNRPWSLDPAVRRRFERRIEIPLPDSQCRAEVLQAEMSGMIEPGVDYAALAAATDGFSCADLNTAARDALMEPVREALAASAFREGPVAAAADVKRVRATALFPCGPDAPGARQGRLLELPPADAARVSVRLCTAADMSTAVARARTSVSVQELQWFREFTDSYGMDGR